MKMRNIYPANNETLKKEENFVNASLIEKDQMIGRDMERARLENQKNFKELAMESSNIDKKELYNRAYVISQRINEKGGIALVVGGFARDSVMKSVGYDLDPKDVDIEVYGIEILELKEILAEFGEVNAVGANFGVLKLGDLDISI